MWCPCLYRPPQNRILSSIKNLRKRSTRNIFINYIGKLIKFSIKLILLEAFPPQEALLVKGVVSAWRGGNGGALFPRGFLHKCFAYSFSSITTPFNGVPVKGPRSVLVVFYIFMLLIFPAATPYILWMVPLFWDFLRILNSAWDMGWCVYRLFLVIKDKICWLFLGRFAVRIASPAVRGVVPISWSLIALVNVVCRTEGVFFKGGVCLDFVSHSLEATDFVFPEGVFLNQVNFNA